MIITLSPVRKDSPMTLERQNDALIINGEAFDFAPLEEGATLPSEAINSEWFVGPVTKYGGKISVTLALPHSENAPHATRHPAPIIDPPNGPITLPAYAGEVTTDV